MGIQFNGKQYFRSKYIFAENNKIEISFSNYIVGLTFQSLITDLDTNGL